MKKIFAIFAVVILAGAMLTACGKKKDNTLTVKLGDTEWTANDVYADVTLPEYMILAASENYSDDNVAYIQGTVGYEAGTYAMADGYVLGYFENANDVDSSDFGNWQATAASQDLKTVDLNAKTIDGTANQTMKNNKTNVSGVAMDVTMTNVQWAMRDMAKNGNIVI